MIEVKTGTEDLSELHDIDLARRLRELSSGESDEALIEAAALRIERFNRLSKLLGMLAPAGTAPRTAFEQIYEQSALPVTEESPIILELRGMLQQHWGEWTPAIREAEGLPPVETEQLFL